MYNRYRRCPYYDCHPEYRSYYMQNEQHANPYDQRGNQPMSPDTEFTQFDDYGPDPIVFNIEEVTKLNNTFRTALWTGRHLQLTLMSINPGEDIGLEMHPNLDQFVRIEQGEGFVKMGDRKDALNYHKKVYEDFAFIIPAGKWHNLINTGYQSLKLYSIYAPPQHPSGTIHETKAQAMAEDAHHHY